MKKRKHVSGVLYECNNNGNNRNNHWQQWSIHKKLRICLYVFVILAMLLPMFSGITTSSAQGEGELVYVVYVHETVERGMLRYMERAFAEAIDDNAAHIILEVNTPGGAVDAAGDIGDLIQQTTIPITAFINSDATSAGAFIALNADNIAIVPHGSFGSAQVIDLEGNAADAKVMAYWKSKMGGAAEANDRDPIYALAMVDPTVEIEGLVTDRQLLDFTASTAFEHGYAEVIADNRADVLAFLDLEKATIVEVEITAAEQLARFITHPIVASILLSLASLGLILELYSPGFGIPGAVGISSLLLFFFGHLVAGFAGIESIILLVVGIILIAIEIFIPGFGIFGILGLAALGGSIALASQDWMIGIRSIGIALAVSFIFIILLTTVFHKQLNRGLWSKIVLEEGLQTNETMGTFEQKSQLLGQKGVTMTRLRPSGTAKIGGKKYDVVSEGSFIDIDTEVEVVKVEGPRVVVAEVESIEE